MAHVHEDLLDEHLSVCAGPDFSYTERTKGGNIVKAALITPVFACLGLFVALAAKFTFLQRLLPSPSEGPSRKTMENGHFHVENFAQGSGRDDLFVHSFVKVRL